FSYFILIPTLRTAKTPMEQEKARMRKICIALILYSARYGEVFPEKLSELYTKNYLDNMEYFDSPYVDGKPTSPEDIDNGIDYLYMGSYEKINGDYLPLIKLNSKSIDLVAFVSKKDIKFNKLEK
ncbi:MAG TPA: hypothetical protein PLJ44_10825, partial [Victivallales bacterium]|nr:hypothetical protein [Victivallales bacterium]